MTFYSLDFKWFPPTCSWMTLSCKLYLPFVFRSIQLIDQYSGSIQLNFYQLSWRVKVSLSRPHFSCGLKDKILIVSFSSWYYFSFIDLCIFQLSLHIIKNVNSMRDHVYLIYHYTLNGAFLEPCLAQSRKPIDVCWKNNEWMSE